MNNLQDLIKAIKAFILVIKAANTKGLWRIQRDKFSYEIERDTYGYLSIHLPSGTIHLDTAHIEEIAKEFDAFVYIAKVAEQYLYDLLKAFDEAKELLSPFVLQEKLS